MQYLIRYIQRLFAYMIGNRNIKKAISIHMYRNIENVISKKLSITEAWFKVSMQNWRCKTGHNCIQGKIDNS